MKQLFFALALIAPIWSAAQAPSLDINFGNNGIATSQTPGWSKIANDLVQQPDGKLLAAGTEYETNGDMYFMSLVTRFLPGGSPDNTFGANGSVRLNTGAKSSVEAIALQSDGKIVLAGNEYIILEEGNPPSATLLSRPFIARLKADGTLDSSFGANGIHRLNILNPYIDKELAAIAVLPDGRIVAGGTVGWTTLDMMLVCLHPDGTYDNNFGNGGMAQYSMVNGQNAILWDMALQNDGKIIIAGSSGNASLVSPEDMLFAMARINADGMPDAGFGTQGKVVTQVAPGINFISDIAHEVILQPDGKICLAGASANALALARYHSDGTPDNSFGQNGTIRHEGHPAATGLAFRDGKLYTCGALPADDTLLDITLSALNADGSTDATFAPNGLHTARIYDRNYTYALLAQPDGKLVTAGSFKDGDHTYGLLLTRFTTTPPTTGIKPAEGSPLNIVLYPNPAGDVLTLTFTDVKTPNEGAICILDASGKTVYSAELKGNKWTLPVSHLAAGTYALRVTAGTRVQTLRFVKQ